uniref:phospholipase D n=1 Tax=Mucochytrium quahogii TaxID=96639 RepID=A0A7S2SC01_9STRA|mmetsp:Transcript_6921/g.12261  ORF Transcript_6921/g.12261 Transcript_6921/m.12261 type:complete len:1066 (-) Transcript_6921:2321-5518(-)|eukprot:CAMPEP_0203759006 /NCGR_PEP_ID=MMETSP0098-20131031/11918_1 /ASSEMBLY_ACC=CAM_ASM_000208 /TAXON_ID=96639 /ORGANISM=" , Strain NY0313808BC1" /LENGTH=1065 /DNA_ID=CAMNT_0050651721 /DNA_START=515 /DNA_END=3712 /DNA_ORIENTATION=-
MEKEKVGAEPPAPPGDTTQEGGVEEDVQPSEQTNSQNDGQPDQATKEEVAGTSSKGKMSQGAGENKSQCPEDSGSRPPRVTEDDESDSGDEAREDDVLLSGSGISAARVTLHGRLEVFIQKAYKLVNKDGLGGCMPGASGPQCGLLGLSDPMCKLIIADDAVVRSSVKSNTLNPKWNELFSVDVCHDANRVTLRIVDVDDISEQFLGQVSFSAEQVLKQAQGASGVQGEFPLTDEKEKIEDLDTYAARWAEDKRDKHSRRKGNKYGWVSFRLRFTPSNQVVEKQRAVYESKKSAAEISKKKLYEHFHPNVVPNTYFKAHAGDHFVVYQSAHQPGMGKNLPAIEKDGGEAPYVARSCWNDLYACLEAAEQFICCCGWSVNPDTRLVRTGAGHESKLTFGEMLKKKASEGVLVYVMVWDDLSSNRFFKTGMMGTFDEQVVDYFKGTGVVAVKVPRIAKAGIIESFSKGTFAYTHHQKTIIMDIKPADASRLKIKHRKHKNKKVQGLTAFVGGIDITSGRYDDSDKTLFGSLLHTHKGDFYQQCLPQDAINKSKGPRQPWQDIHSRVTGRAAVDILKNFIERWHWQVGDHRHPTHKSFKKGMKMRKLLTLIKDTPAEHALPRSLLEETKDNIIGRTETLLHVGHGSEVNCSRNNYGMNQQNLGDDEMSDEEIEELQNDLDDLGDRDRTSSLNDCFSTTGEENADKVVQVIRSIDEDSARLEKRITPPHVSYDKDLKFDNSIHKAFVHHIRHANHFVYVESQYFIGSCHLWEKSRHCGANNLVAAEIAQKCCDKIRANEPFHAYVCIPMFCEGIPRDSAVYQILRWQYFSVQMMYRRIAQALKTAGMADSKKPTDYLTFYFLGNREAAEQDKVDESNHSESMSIDPSLPEDDYKNVYKKLLKARRFMIYVHSKMLVVDDEVAVVGSANVNQRSFAGNRDSEIGVCMFEASKMATETTTPRGEVYGMRMSVWAEHLGGSLMEDPEFDATVLQHPGSPECVKLVSERALENWNAYVAEGEPVNVPGHLMRYPYKVLDDGSVTTFEGFESFPDFPKSKILGAKTRLPNYLTT